MSQTIVYPTEVVNTPGPTGAGGALPVRVTVAFLIPAIAATVWVNVQTAVGFSLNQNVFVGNANFIVSDINLTQNMVQLTFLGFFGDTNAGAQIDAGSIINSGTGNLTAASNVSVTWTINGTVQTGALNVQAGYATLAAGTVTVTGVTLTSNSVILLSRKSLAGAAGNLYTSGRNTIAGQFVINSSSATETSIIDWVIIG